MLYSIAEAAKSTGLEESLFLKAIEDGQITVRRTSQVNGTSRTQNCIRYICPSHRITANVSGKQIYEEATEGVNKLRSQTLPTVTRAEVGRRITRQRTRRKIVRAHLQRHQSGRMGSG